MQPASATLPAEAAFSPIPPPITGAPVAAPPWPIAILGVPFDPVTTTDALTRIEAMIASRRPHYVVTANVDFLVQAHGDVELRRILLEADLVLCDGTPLVWASRWLGNPLPERVAGADLVPRLMAAAARQGHRVFLLGAGPGVAADAAARLERDYPGIQVAGHFAPPFAPLLELDHAEITRRIRAAQPDILLVSFGCPKQEKWIAMHHRELGVPVAIGVGATMDFLAGRVRRAPAWMRRAGLEWAYRLAQEPRRLFRRYAKDLVGFLPRLIAEWWRLRRSAATPAGPRLLPMGPTGWCGIDAGEQLTRCALVADAAFWHAVIGRREHGLADLSRLRSIDGTGIAFLLRWRRNQRAQRRHLVLLAPSRTVRRALESMRLDDLFVTARDAGEAVRAAEAARLGPPSVQRDGTTRSVAWCGEIIAANAGDVWRMTTDHVGAFARQSATLVIIDLAELQFVDSAGAALMLRIKRWAREQALEILFARPAANVRNVLRLAGIDHLLLEGGQ